MILEQKYETNQADIENICKIAIDKLRANNGCDITFEYVDDVKKVVDPASIIWLTVKFNGEYNKIVFTSDVFLDTFPHDLEEEKARSAQSRIILRVAKMLYGYYGEWKQRQGLATNVKPYTYDQPLTASYDTVNIAKQDLISDSITDLKNKIDYSEQEVTRLKDILSDTRDEKAKLEVEVQNLKDQLNLVLNGLYNKGIL